MPESLPQWRTIGELADTNPEALGVGADPRAHFKYVDLSSVTLGTVAWNSAPDVTLLTAPSRARRVLRRGDVLFGTVRPNLQSHGYVDWAGDSTLVGSTGFSVIRAKAGVSDPRYMFHCIMSSGVTAQANRDAVGSSYPALNDRDVRRFQVFAPPVGEQVAVAQILDTLDTTIRQTEAIIEKLKQVKQGLLHDLLTRGIDANGELRPPQSQAPHLYKNSLLGWIPREWVAGPLSSWLEGRPKNGYSPQPAGRWTGIQMLGLGCLTANGFEPRQLKDAPLGDPLVPKAFLIPGDLLMSRANTRELVGLVGTYRDVGTPCCYPDLMMRLTPNAKASATFLELVLRSPQARRQIQASASGTSGSMVKISSTIVIGLGVAMPELAEQGRILECLGASDRRLTAEVAVVEQLLALKSGVMDDLLTGRVRVTPLLHTADTCP